MDEKMDSCDSDDEKVNVLHRYKLFLNIATLFQLIEFFIAVALIFWSLSRLISVLNLSGDNLLTFSSNFSNQHVVFIFGNVIIVVCYVLSRRTEEGNRSEMYDEKYGSSSQRKTTEDASIGEMVTPLPKATQATAESSGAENRNTEGRYEDAVVKTESETAIEVAIKQAVRQIERFRRTQSEKLKRKMSIKPQRELQLSATEERWSEMMEKLSNEEFRLAVEIFISNKQKFLKQEGMAEGGTNL